MVDICKSCGNPIPTGEAYSRYHGIEAKDGTGVARLPEGPWHKLCIPPRKVSAAEATEVANAMVADIRHEDSPHAGHLYYVKVKGRCPPPYTTRRRVEAIIDIADDGTLAGIELIDKMPPPPVDACKPYKAETT